MRAAPSNFVPLDREMRFRVEETIERLIAILDASDGSPDLEDADPAEESDNGIADYDGLDEYEGERAATAAFAIDRHYRAAQSLPAGMITAD